MLEGKRRPRDVSVDAKAKGRRFCWLRQSPLVPLLAGLVARVAGLRNGFVLDDLPDIVHHPVVSGKAPLSAIFQYNFMGHPLGQGPNTIRPLVTADFSLEWWLWGGSPLGFQLTSILLYLAVVTLVWLLLRRLTGGAVAVLGATLFAVTALHSEVVASAAHRTETMAMALGLGTLLLLLKEPLRWVHVLFAWLLFMLALLSKESALAFAPIAILLFYLLARWRGRLGQIGHLGIVVVAGAWLLGRGLLLGFTLQGKVISADNPLIGAAMAERLWTPWILIGRYLRQTFAPLWLAHDHSYAAVMPSSALADPYAWMGLALILALLASVIFTRRRTGPALTLLRLGAGGFFCAYLIVANGPVLIVTIFAERLFFAPSLWLLFWLVGLFWLTLEQVPTRTRRLLAVAVSCWALLQAGISWNRATDWQSHLTLARAQVESEPRCVRGHLELATTAARQGEVDLGLWHLAIAISGRSAFPRPWQPPLEPRVHQLPLKERLGYLPQLLAPGAPKLQVLRKFRPLTRRFLGAAGARRIDKLARHLGGSP